MDQIINNAISINAPTSKVWNTLTNPATMKRWMSDTEMNIFSAWIVGSPIIFRGDLHGIKYNNKGTILQFLPENIFEYSYLSSLSGFPDIPENYSLITFKLTPIADKTTLSFTQRNFITEVNYRHFNFYWNTALHLLKKISEN